MHDKNFYDKEQMSGNVDTLMNDMTIGTRTRRKRDADALSKIREKQAYEKSETHAKTGIFSKIKNMLSDHKRVEEDNDDLNKTEYMSIPIRHVNVPPPALQVFSVSEDDDWGDDTVVLDEDFDDGDATVVMEEEAPAAILLFVNDGKTYRGVIGSGKTSIGSQSGKNDIVVDSKRISRVHAEIICHEGEMFIKDCGSTNGTYLNGSRQRLPKGVEYKINIGDVITLADTEFYIYEYGVNV